MMRFYSKMAFLLLMILQIPMFGKGNLVIIGGALKDDNTEIYRLMIELGGGTEKIRIAVIPAASSYPADTGKKTQEAFGRYGIPGESVRVFPLAVKDDPGTDQDESQWRSNAMDKAIAAELREYNLIFMSGGDQSRLGDLFIGDDGCDTPALESIRQVYASGGTIAGTSAGAAVMSDPMITSGTSITSVTGNLPADASADVNSEHLTLRKGFGLIREFLVDQHFIIRGRIGRLIAALIQKKDGITRGVGIDEDTALWINGNEASVIGRSGVLLCDISRAKTEMTQKGLMAAGIRINYLHAGDRINLKTREYTIHPGRKLIRRGKEYFTSARKSSDIFAKDAFLDILTSGVADNRHREASGIGFFIHSETNMGARLTLSKSEFTKSYLGKINGEYTYSVIHAEMAIQPITVIIR